MKFKLKLLSFGLMIVIISACGLINEKNKGKGFNVFPISTDRNLGLQVSSQIDNDPSQYPLLDSNKYSRIYKYLYGIRDQILNSGQVTLKDDFSWRLRIVKDDNTLNAFCTPGGYIYFYTGILKYLDSEDQLAGVMAHEIAHADMRHSTRQLTSMYGLQLIEQVALGNSTMLSQLVISVAGLKFSRKHESQADEMSVKYLCGTDYNAAGGAGFFQKLMAEGQGAQVPEFLSTHPSSDKRIEEFINHKITMGCSGNQNFKARYQDMIKTLP